MIDTTEAEESISTACRKIENISIDVWDYNDATGVWNNKWNSLLKQYISVMGKHITVMRNFIEFNFSQLTFYQYHITLHHIYRQQKLSSKDMCTHFLSINLISSFYHHLMFVMADF